MRRSATFEVDAGELLINEMAPTVQGIWRPCFENENLAR